MAKDNRVDAAGDFFEALAVLLGTGAVMCKATSQVIRTYDKLEKEIDKQIADVRVVNAKV